TWIATALALVSTCGTIPDLVQEGSVETMLSRPISRVRLLLTKYSLGLLFVAFQVLIFSAGSVLVFGIRAGVWEPRIFLAVPIVVLFYSYLFSICALVGLLTRSTIAALLVTALAWFGLFLANTADEMLLGFQKVAEARVELRQQRLHLEEGMATTELRRRLEESQTLPEDWAPTPAELDESSPSVVLWREQVEESQSNAESLEFWHDVAVWVKLVLPKTAETIALLDRELIDPERITVSQARENDRPRDDDERAMMLGAERTQAALRERSLAWVLGTSFAFEAFILGICCVIFARKDY
ncbi:MAG: ABC transporter permease, partial [Planctomycetota bacterium]